MTSHCSPKFFFVGSTQVLKKLGALIGVIHKRLQTGTSKSHIDYINMYYYVIYEVIGISNQQTYNEWIINSIKLSYKIVPYVDIEY